MSSFSEMFKKLKKEKKLKYSQGFFAVKEKPEEKKVLEPKPIVEESAKISLKTDSVEEVKEIEEVSVPKIKTASIQSDLVSSKKTKIAAYGNVEIFQVEGQDLLVYNVPVPRPNLTEKTIINTIKEVATRLIAIEPYKIRDPEEKRNVYFQKILDILREAEELNIPESKFPFYADAVVREMVGYGLIDELIRDNKLEEIMIIGPKTPVYVFHREYEMMLTNIEFYSDTEVQDLINKIARGVGRRVDISNPLLDARLPDGSRVNATIPPASVSGSTLTIRKFRDDPFSLIDLINYGTISVEVAAFLWLSVDGFGVKPSNSLIAGGTGSGKTTTLNVLASLIPSNERIVSIEDTAELNIPLSHWIRLEAKPPGLEGKGELTMDILTKNSLRMRPDRIVVGEVRHSEAFTLFTAMNTGHNGSLGTIHSNSPQETIVRVTNPPMNVPELMLSSLDLILIQHRLHDRKKGSIRRVTEIAEVSGVLEGKIQVQTIFSRNAVKDSLEATDVQSKYLKEIELLSGLSKKDIKEDLSDREKFLQALVDKGIRSIDEVVRETQRFLFEKKQI